MEDEQESLVTALQQVFPGRIWADCQSVLGATDGLLNDGRGIELTLKVPKGKIGPVDAKVQFGS